MPWKIAVRDAVLVLLTFALWLLDARTRTHGAGFVPLGVAGAAGVMTAVCGYLAHEWGHFAGARLSSSVVHLPTQVGAVFLFHFDSDQNNRAQFVAMSCGGLLASALVMAGLLRILPLQANASRVALALVGLGLVATVILEVPIVWRVARGAPLPHGSVYKASATPSPPSAPHPAGRS
jgi:hypothetical protein